MATKGAAGGAKAKTGGSGTNNQTGAGAGAGYSVGAAVGSGLPVTAPVFDDATIMEQIKAKYPAFSHLLNDPEIRDVLMEAARTNMSATELQARVMGTNWWRTHAESARKYETLVGTDPASAQRLVASKRTEIYQIASQAGISLPPEEANRLADMAVRWAWDDAEVKAALADVGRRQPNATQQGSLGGSRAAVLRYARDYLVPMSEATAGDWAMRIFEGTATLEGAESYFRTQAKQRFGWLSDQIDAGFTPGMYYEPLKEIVSQTLEMNPNDIDLMDDRWLPILEYQDDKGNKRGMTYYEAAQWARNQPEWTKTEQANQQAASLVNSLAKVMGRM